MDFWVLGTGDWFMIYGLGFRVVPYSHTPILQYSITPILHQSFIFSNNHKKISVITGHTSKFFSLNLKLEHDKTYIYLFEKTEQLL